MLEAVRWSTFAATAVLAVFGYSDQLRLILAHKSTVGLSFVMVLIFLGYWESYSLCGWFHGDKKIFWPNLVGTVFISFILLSFFVF